MEIGQYQRRPSSAASNKSAANQTMSKATQSGGLFFGLVVPRPHMFIAVLVLLTSWFTGLTAPAYAGTEELRHYDVVIVGGGSAGLLAADILRRAGVPHLLLERDQRPGGRIFSRPERGTHLGLTIDEGANLLNSTDEIGRALLERYHIPYVHRFPDGDSSMAYTFGNRWYSHREFTARLFASNREALKRISRDQQKIASGAGEFAHRFSRLSIAAHLREIGAGKELMRMLSSFFWSEYGKKIDDLNVHVLNDYFAVDFGKRDFLLIPHADEAYTIPSGFGQIATHLAEDNAAEVRYGRQVVEIRSERSGRVILTSLTDEGVERVSAGHVIYAAPLHALEAIRLLLPDVNPSVIADAVDTPYAHGVKLHLKFQPGFHELYKFPGILITESGEQVWVSSFGQPAAGAGLVTVLTGPLVHDDEVVESRIRTVLAQMERGAPGVSRLYAGFERSENAHSYSGVWRPGDAEVPRFVEYGFRDLTVIGEAAGGDMQGYVEGALRSAFDRTHQLLREKCARVAAGI